MLRRVVALTGGVGGAKLVSGLAGVLSDDQLTVIVNTGDDFEHLGLVICPDLDSVIYALAGLANPHTGWGRVDETWNFMEALGELGGPTWFRLGDRDLALHHERTRLIGEDHSLTAVTQHIYQALGVAVAVLPMSDQPVRTIVISDEGELSFQDYFVAHSCEPRVYGFHFDGLKTANPAPGVLEALLATDQVILCPSNPWVSLDPILSVSGVREAVAAKPVIGVSPIVGGKTIKGPAAKMFVDLGFESSALTVAEHFQDILSGMVIDREDEAMASEITLLGMRVLVTDTIMKTADDRLRLAEEIIDFASG